MSLYAHVTHVGTHIQPYFNQENTGTDVAGRDKSKSTLHQPQWKPVPMVTKLRVRLGQEKQSTEPHSGSKTICPSRCLLWAPPPSGQGRQGGLVVCHLEDPQAPGPVHQGL
jgi:hypothetical protein